MELPISVTLKRPITLGDKEIGVLQFDEPTIGAQIDYADLEAELGLDDMREQIAAAPDDTERANLMPPQVSMRVSMFWIEALAGLPKGAARLIKQSDQDAVHEAVDKILNVAGGTGGAVGNGAPSE